MQAVRTRPRVIKYHLSCGCAPNFSSRFHARIQNTVVCPVHLFRVFILKTDFFPEESEIQLLGTRKGRAQAA